MITAEEARSVVRKSVDEEIEFLEALIIKVSKNRKTSTMIKEISDEAIEILKAHDYIVTEKKECKPTGFLIDWSK